MMRAQSWGDDGCGGDRAGADFLGRITRAVHGFDAVGPRLLYRFLQDWCHSGPIGLFTGTFVYICLVVLVTHQDPQSTFIPQISLIMSWVLVVVSLGCWSTTAIELRNRSRILT